MPDSLIEQVKRLAEAQRDTFLFDPMCNPNHARHASVMWSLLPALLAHMQAQQAVVDAAREALWKIAVLRQGCKPPKDGGNEIAWEATGIARAALENLKPRSDNDGK